MYYLFGMQIDHDPQEPPRDRTGNGVLWLAGGMVLVLWLGYYFFDMLDWHSAALGLGSGVVFVVIMTEITGNKVPPWMRR